MIPLRQSEHDFFLTSEFIYILARWTVLAQSWDHVNQRKSILVDQSPGPPDERVGSGGVGSSSRKSSPSSVPRTKNRNFLQMWAPLRHTRNGFRFLGSNQHLHRDRGVWFICILMRAHRRTRCLLAQAMLLKSSCLGTGLSSLSSSMELPAGATARISLAG